MTEELIKQRIADLNAQADQLRANLNAIGGAIQDCEYWLSMLKKPDPAVIEAS